MNMVSIEDKMVNMFRKQLHLYTNNAFRSLPFNSNFNFETLINVQCHFLENITQTEVKKVHLLRTIFTWCTIPAWAGRCKYIVMNEGVSRCGFV